MHAKLTLAASSFLVLALAACATKTSKVSQVHFGMNKTEVVGVLGQPASTGTQGGIEYLTYYLSQDEAAPKRPYMVRLVDRRVESFGRYFQLLDNYNYPQPLPGTLPLGVGAIMPPSINVDLVTQLQWLKALRDQGALTEEEFVRVKQRLLDERS